MIRLAFGYTLLALVLSVTVGLLAREFDRRYTNETSNGGTCPHATTDSVGGDETPEASLRPVARGGDARGDDSSLARGGTRRRDDTVGGAAGVPEAGGRGGGSGSLAGRDERASTEDSGGQVSDMWGLPSSVWLEGYRAHGGNPIWEQRFLETVIPCEGREFDWDWHMGDSFYVSVLQFDPGTWESASHHTGHTNPEDLRHVGANAAYWSNRVDPASTAGWADCW